VLIGEFSNHRNEHGEGLVLVGLQNVQEVIVLEEAHCAVSNLQVDTSDAAHDSLEQAGHKVLDFIDFAHFQHLLELGKEQSLLDAVCERPVSQKAFEKSYSESAVFSQEQHRASQKLLVELRACLHLVKGNDHILEEYDMFVSERHCETTDDARQDV
jgi:hypothetical protein